MKSLGWVLTILLMFGRFALAERIVSGSGVATEILHAIGADNQLVGVDSSSQFPESVRSLPQVGYARQLSAEGILSLRPDLVIVTEEAGPVHVLEQLKATGVPVRVLPSGHTPEAAAQRIRKVGEAVGKSEAAEHLAFELEKQVHGLAKASGDAPRVLFLYARGGGVLNVSGSGTAAAAMIALAGGRNAVEGFEGYKPLTAEAAVQAAPDVILMTTHGLEAAGGWEAILAQPGLSLTPAAKNRRVIGMDDLLLLGFGPRLPLAIEELSGKLHGVRVVGGP